MCYPMIKEVQFLGTGSAYPSPHRGSSSVVVFHSASGQQWMFDCGEGTQIQAQISNRVKMGKIKKIFISHLHGDHLFGLPGLLCTVFGSNPDTSSSKERGDSSPSILHIYGPHGLRKFLRITLGLSRYACHELHFQGQHYPESWSQFGEVNHNLNENEDPPLNYEDEGRDIYPDENGVWKVLEDKSTMVNVRAVWIKHSIPCIGWIIEEENKPGKLDAKRARELGVPEGPLFKKLKLGESVTTKNGITVVASDVVGPEIPGRRIVILGDTQDASQILNEGAGALGASLLVHEATLENSMQEDAVSKGHSTPEMAASLAKRLMMPPNGVLILTHFSQRYTVQSNTEEVTEESSINKLVEEARLTFNGNVLGAEDFLLVSVPK